VCAAGANATATITAPAAAIVEGQGRGLDEARHLCLDQSVNLWMDSIISSIEIDL
jgi:hypothetical protein